MFFHPSKSNETHTEKGSALSPWLILLVAAAGILLLLLGSGGKLGQEQQEEGALAAPTPQEELEAYQTQLERRIKALCESVSGVSGVSVAVTLSGSFEEVYATEQSDGNEEYVIVGSGSSASALHLSRIPPKPIGIGVVCHGGGNADIRRELSALLSASFDIPSNRIYITEAKS